VSPKVFLLVSAVRVLLVSRAKAAQTHATSEGSTLVSLLPPLSWNVIRMKAQRPG
jgi:hypothetical protein